jgi:hypothetical protein
MSIRWFDVLAPGISSIPGVRNTMKDFTDRMMGSGKYDPVSKAEPWLEKAGQQFDPYIQQGQQAYGQLNPIYSQMASDPAAMLEQLMGQYQESPASKAMRDKAVQAAANTAAAGGMRGSFQDQEGESQLANMLMQQDMQQWLNNAMGVQGRGLGGLSDFYNKGYGASSDLANVYGSRAGLGFQGQSQQNQRLQDIINALIKGGSQAAGMAAGGGFM